MSFFEFPHTRTYDNDLGWLIKKIGEMATKLDNFVNFNAIKYADPIEWNIARQYEANTVVIDPLDGTAYISTNPVPNGVDIGNTDYWTPIFNYGENMNQLRAELEQMIADLEDDVKITSGVVHKTVTDMIADKTLAADTLVRTVGYYSVTDGGGAFYLISDRSGGESSIEVKLSNGKFGKLIHSGMVCTSQLGIFPDIEDNTPVMTRVLNSRAFKKIYFDKQGTYKFSDHILLHSNLEFYGTGHDTILYCTRDNADQFGTFIGPVWYGAGIQAEFSTNIFMHDFSVDMYEPAVPEDVNAISFGRSDNIRIENIKIKRSNWRGVNFDTGIARNITIRNVIVEKVEPYQGIRIGNADESGSTPFDITNILIDNCRISGCTTDAMSISGHQTRGNCRNIKITNCVIDGNGHRGIFVQLATGVHISNCTFINYTNSAVTVALSKNVNVSNCIDITEYAASMTNIFGFILFNSTTNITMSGLIAEKVQVGVRLLGTTSLFALTNSTLVNCFGTSVYSQSADATGIITGCVLSPAPNISASPNIVLGTNA